MQDHPCLQELHLDPADKAWLQAIPWLPALSTLGLRMSPRLFEGEGREREAGRAAQELGMCGWLERCQTAVTPGPGHPSGTCNTRP